VNLVADRFPGQTIGLIGTKRTVESNIYKQNVDSLGKDIEIKSLATPLLVPMIEEGYIHNKISTEIIEEYLKSNELKNISALILGCTHYPLIRDEISDFYKGQVEILDSSEVVSLALKSYLDNNNLLNQGGFKTDHFLVSDFTPSFEASAALFFQKKLHLEMHKLWE